MEELRRYTSHTYKYREGNLRFDLIFKTNDDKDTTDKKYGRNR